LHSPSDRLTLWRDTIQLFHRYAKPPFVGPFKALGFRYRVGAELMTMHGDIKVPDVVASGPSGWALIDITSDERSKAAQLDGYRALDPRYLGTIGLPPQSSLPDTLSSRSARIDDGAHCQLLFFPTLEVSKVEHLGNSTLREALLRSTGMDPTTLPSISFTLIPESISKGKEVRRGIASCVLQSFAPGSGGISLSEIVDSCLERLADKVSVSTKRALIDAVRDHLRVLVRDFLPDHLELGDDLIRTRPGVTSHPRTLDRVGSAIKRWAEQTPSVPLDRFA